MSTHHNREPAPSDTEPQSGAVDLNTRIVGADADALKQFFVTSFKLLRDAPTYKDDQRCLDASGDVVELPDGTFELREEK